MTFERLNEIKKIILEGPDSFFWRNSFTAELIPALEQAISEAHHAKDLEYLKHKDKEKFQFTVKRLEDANTKLFNENKELKKIIQNFKKGLN